MSIYGTITEASRNESVSLSATSQTISNARNELNPRKVITIRNISPNATDTITIALSSYPAVANNGLVLKQYESFTDANDGQYQCWQGQIQAIGTATAVVSIFER